MLYIILKRIKPKEYEERNIKFRRKLLDMRQFYDKNKNW